MKKSLVKLAGVMLVAFVYIQFNTGAMWIPGSGASGDNTGPGTWGNSTTDAVQLTYDELSNLCATANIAIQGNHYQAALYEFADGIYARISTSGTKAYIQLYSKTGSAQGWYLQAVGNNNTVAGRYWAYTPINDSRTLKPIYDKIEAIRSLLSSNILTVLNNIYSSVDGLESYVDAIEGSLSQIVSSLSNQATTLNNIYGRLSYTDSSGVTGSVASFLYNIQNRLVFTTGNLTYSAGDLLYNIWQRLTFTIDGTTHSAASLLYNIWQKSNDLYGAVDGVETTLNALSSDVSTMKSDLHSLVTNVYVTLYTGDSSGTAYSTIAYRPDVINDYIAYLNQNFQNKQVNVLYRDQDGVATGTVRTFMYADVYNGYVRMRLKLPSGGVAYGYLATPNKVLIKEAQTYVDDLTFYQKLTSIETAINSISTDNSSVVAAIDRIYEWLDNADLATNATIIQVVQDYSNDVNHSVDWASRILDLFKRVYIFDRPAPSFSGILDYFGSLGSD